MPDPPHVDFFTRFVLENPYPLTAVLGAVAVVTGVLGLRDGRRGMLYTAAGFALVSAGVLTTGLLVRTPAEHGEAVTRTLVDRAVEADVSGALALFADGAVLTVGSPRNPGQDLDFIASRLRLLEDRYAVQSNRITSLRGYTVAADEAVVHLSCRTEVAGGWGPTPSQWVLEIARQEDGQWRITRLTAVSIAGRTPRGTLW